MKAAGILTEAPVGLLSLVRSWRDAAEKPQLWQSFVCRTFASKEQAAFVEMLHSTVRELPPWHAIFSSMAKGGA